MKKITIAISIAVLTIASIVTIILRSHHYVSTVEINTDHVKDVIWVISPQNNALDSAIVSSGNFTAGLANVQLENGSLIFIDKNGKNAFPGLYSQRLET